MPSTAAKLVDRLAAQPMDGYTLRELKLLKRAMALMPMKLVLDKVPGETVTAQAQLLGISRNTFYSWQRGEVRPTRKQAARLQELTGIDAAKFQGRR